MCCSLVAKSRPTPVAGDGVQQVANITKWMKTAVTLDWDSVNANRPAWNARWNKTIER